MGLLVEACCPPRRNLRIYTLPYVRWRWLSAAHSNPTVLPENVVRPNVTRRDARTRDAARPGSVDPRLGPRSGAVTVAAGRPEPTVRAPGAVARGCSARRTPNPRPSAWEADALPGCYAACPAAVSADSVCAPQHRSPGKASDAGAGSTSSQRDRLAVSSLVTCSAGDARSLADPAVVLVAATRLSLRQPVRPAGALASPRAAGRGSTRSGSRWWPRRSPPCPPPKGS